VPANADVLPLEVQTALMVERLGLEVLEMDYDTATRLFAMLTEIDRVRNGAKSS